LLDQVDELSPGARAKLLRFLEEQRVSDKPAMRVMATTMRDLEKVSARAMDLLISHSWPGNVRELENVIEGALAFCDEDERLLTERHLPAWIREGATEVCQID